MNRAHAPAVDGTAPPEPPKPRIDVEGTAPPEPPIHLRLNGLPRLSRAHTPAVVTGLANIAESTQHTTNNAQCGNSQPQPGGGHKTATRYLGRPEDVPVPVPAGFLPNLTRGPVGNYLYLNGNKYRPLVMPLALAELRWKMEDRRAPPSLFWFSGLGERRGR